MLTPNHDYGIQLHEIKPTRYQQINARYSKIDHYKIQKHKQKHLKKFKIFNSIYINNFQMLIKFN